ncbi:hypothetical protein V5F53_20570 [Xanthobacter sp. V4C-4]|uniref:hypothetical protein n=1 Tax=Xanthobacter cornucopiae TaxID=3119924 RepID=UPI0037264F27
MIRFARRVLCALALIAPWPLAAAPVDDYLAARDRAVAAAVAAAKTGTGGDAASLAAEQAALQDLAKRMRALVGPLKVKGLGAPAFSLDILIFGRDEPIRQLDGLTVANTDETTRVLVTPEPVFQAWLAARAEDKEAPAVFRDGPAAAAGTEYFANNSILSIGSGFWPYATLPLAAGAGETVVATLGIFTDEAPANQLPNSIVLLRVAEGRATVAFTRVAVDKTRLPACDATWKPYAARIDGLRRDAEKGGNPDDPRWVQISQAYDQGSAAFRACYATAVQGQPALTTAARRAEGLLATLRGN